MAYLNFLTDWSSHAYLKCFSLGLLLLLMCWLTLTYGQPQRDSILEQVLSFIALAGLLTMSFSWAAWACDKAEQGSLRHNKGS